MSNIAVEQVSVTRTGVSFVPTKENLKKAGFLAPGAQRIVPIVQQKVPRRGPNRIMFGMLRDRRLKMIQAIPVEIGRSGKTVTASWETVQEFGYGRNTSEALDDFGRTIEELFLSLHERQSKLGDDLKQMWQVLSKHIQLKLR